ncbi:MAG: DNA-directed RNA polymerase subunit omega [Propionibacteriaceae bacterium]|nr:DNA-directed RNA polymerase subunit omega [Propionibacteriaceae bacterium]
MNTFVPEGITNPPIDELLTHADSKYRLVLFAAKRARQINAYYSQLGEGLLENVGPLVEPAHDEKPLTIALREINESLLECHEIDPEAEAAAREEALKDDTFGLADQVRGFDYNNPFGDPELG